MHNEIRRPRIEMLRHRADGTGNDAQLRPFFSGMYQTDRIADGIDDENSTAISDINAEANATLVCDQSVTTVETLVSRGWLIDNTDTLSMHLLRGNERRAAEPVCSPDFPMNAVQPGERLHFVMRHFDSGDTQGKTVNQIRPRAERRKMFSRELTCVHLPEVVVRERVVCTGSRMPA